MRKCVFFIAFKLRNVTTSGKNVKSQWNGMWTNTNTTLVSKVTHTNLENVDRTPC